MKKISLQTHPKDASAKALRTLSSTRVREVLERRFGLRGKEPETLEAIGRSFGVTRERVRQIEAEGLRALSKAPATEALAPVLSSLEGHFADHGEVFEESKLLASVTEPRFHNHVYFLLNVAKPFSRRGEDGEWHPRWYTKEESLKSAETIIGKTAEALAEIKRPVAASELFQILKTKAREVLGAVPNPDALDSYLALSKTIRQNPHGEFGLTTWATIHPRGVRDRAYAVLSKSGKPMHFREVASAITKTGWTQKRAHPQTVHNELIKDNRFVLVGRGLYALKEWGYEPGTVADVITGVMKTIKRPLSKEEIARRVLERRFVKPNTVFLNLQDKSKFKRTTEGYTLV
jgi:hypothetical protein